MNTTERYEIENGVTLFEIGVKTVDQLYDMRDPSPFRERDLDDDLVEFVLSRAQELPVSAPMRLRIIVSAQAVDQTHKEAIVSSFHNHFEYEADLLAQELRRNYRMGRVFFAIGMACLSVCLVGAEFSEQILPPSTFQKILHEGLTISGWVAMWRPLEVFLYSWWPTRQNKRYVTKLAQVPIEVRALM